MNKVTKDNLFKPSMSKGELKGDATTRAARAIIDREVADRDAKTARLKIARLAKEAEERDAAPAPAPARKTVRKAAAKTADKTATKTAAKAAPKTRAAE
jgi:hypothetical protein